MSYKNSTQVPTSPSMQVLPTKVPTPLGIGSGRNQRVCSTAPSHRQLRGEVAENGMSRSRIGETISHEKAYAASYRGSTTQQFQGRDDDRDRSWGCLEPLLHAQRRWRSSGPGPVSRGGKQSRNRAIVAVARKLAVLLHRIWITQEPYIPFYAVAA